MYASLLLKDLPDHYVLDLTFKYYTTVDDKHKHLFCPLLVQLDVYLVPSSAMSLESFGHLAVLLYHYRRKVKHMAHVERVLLQIPSTGIIINEEGSPTEYDSHSKLLGDGTNLRKERNAGTRQRGAPHLSEMRMSPESSKWTQTSFRRKTRLWKWNASKFVEIGNSWRRDES